MLRNNHPKNRFFDILSSICDDSSPHTFIPWVQFFFCSSRIPMPTQCHGHLSLGASGEKIILKFLAKLFESASIG